MVLTKERQKEYQREWYQRKKNGLPTRLHAPLTKRERAVRKKSRTSSQLDSLRRYRRTLVQWRQGLRKQYFGDVCRVCRCNRNRMGLHKKDGSKHKKHHAMTKVEFMEAVKSGEYVLLCYTCHKSTHWAMQYLKMNWNEIECRLK